MEKKENNQDTSDHVIIIESDDYEEYLDHDENEEVEDNEENKEVITVIEDIGKRYKPASLFEKVISDDDISTDLPSPPLITENPEILDKEKAEEQRRTFEYQEIAEEETRRKEKEQKKEAKKRSTLKINERDRDIFQKEDEPHFFWKKSKKDKIKRKFDTPEEEQIYKQSVLARPLHIVHTLFTLSELFCITLIEIMNGSVCVKTNELKLVTFYVVTINYSIFFSDMFLFALMLINVNVCFKPLGIIYHFLAFTLLLSAASYLLCSLTYCGNVAQIMLLVVGIIGIFTSLMHLSNFIMIVVQFPKYYFVNLKNRIKTTFHTKNSA
ncbi:hypothetical protein ACFFRR_008533 [Megaselia abdita]